MWRGRVSKSLQTFTAHALLFCFTILLFLKLDHHIFPSWWIIFFPLFLFHLVVARGRFLLPAPAASLGHHWVPCHAIVGMPLLVAFELLLCVFLESVYVMRIPAIDLGIVFLPLLVFEFIICADNFRVFLPGDEENLRDDEISERPHFWVGCSMMSFFAATLLTLLKLGDGTDDIGWLGPFIYLGIADCFAFLFCIKWCNPAIHRNSQAHEGSSSTGIRYLDWNSGRVVASDDISVDRMCGLQDIGGHIMKALVIAFQILLFIRLKEKPAASNIPLSIVFSPLLLLQGAVVLFSGSELVEKILLLNNGTRTGRYFVFSAGARDFFGILYRGSRLLGWSSIDEESREEQARLYHDGALGRSYNTFCGSSPEVVKKMPKKDLAQEVGRLQAALGEKMKTTKFSLQEVERLQNEKILCRVCFERQLSIVLLPCRHWILCSMCSVKCKKCPICRAVIEERLPIYDV